MPQWLRRLGKRELGHSSEALTYFREALGAWKRVADANPARYADGLEVGISHSRIGWLLFGTGQTEESIKEFEAARAVYQKLVDSFPPQDVHRTRSELANVMINLAEIQRRQKRLAEARGLCDQAIFLLQTLGKEYPAIVDYRARLGECLLRSGQIRLAAGDTPGAAADWRRALLVNQDLPPRTGEEAMFEAGCHAMLSSVAGVSGSGVSATDGPSEVEKAMAILRRDPCRRLPCPRAEVPNPASNRSEANLSSNSSCWTCPSRQARSQASNRACDEPLHSL